jgi:hypothetical protein
MEDFNLPDPRPINPDKIRKRMRIKGIGVNESSRLEAHPISKVRVARRYFSALSSFAACVMTAGNPVDKGKIHEE